MPERAAENFAKALDRARDESLTREQHEAAIDELLAAHGRLLAKQGVDVAGPRRVVGQILAGALLIAVCTAMVLLIVYSKEGADTAAEAKATAHAVERVQGESIKAQRESCERTNDAREASIVEKRADLRNFYRPSLRLWKGAVAAEGIDPKTPKLVVERFDNFLERLEDGIATKETGIEQALRSIKDVAIKPGSPRADCTLVVPGPSGATQSSP